MAACREECRFWMIRSRCSVSISSVYIEALDLVSMVVRPAV